MRPTPWPYSDRRRRRGPRAGSFGRRRAAAPSPASAGGLGAAGRLQSSSGLPRRNEVLLRSGGAQGPEQCVCPLGKVPNVSKRTGKQESEWCSGVAWDPWVAPRGGVYDPVSSRARRREGPTEGIELSRLARCLDSSRVLLPRASLPLATAAAAARKIRSRRTQVLGHHCSR